MGVGHVPQDPLRAQGAGADVQGRQRGGASLPGSVDAAPTRSLARQALGRWGEDCAARWYVDRGFVVVDRNWRAPGGELDLVVRRARLVAFVEVKTRAGDAYGDPALAVTWRKQQRIRRLAASWLAAGGVHDVEVRFDVVAVTGVRVHVIEAAF